MKQHRHNLGSMILFTIGFVHCWNLLMVTADTDQNNEHLPVKQIISSRNKNRKRLLQTKGDSKKSKDSVKNRNNVFDNNNDDHTDYNDDQYYHNGKGGSQPPPLPSPPEWPTPPTTDLNDNCVSAVAQKIRMVVPEVITQNPSRCCQYDGPVGVYITNSLPSDNTISGFEIFWDKSYQIISNQADIYNTCFVMTGYNPTLSQRSLSDIMISTNRFVSTIQQVPAMMTTDPTDTIQLTNEIRFISDSIINGPAIGVFNSGYNNLNIESIVSRMDRLPYIGYLNDRDYGTQSALFAQTLLQGTEAKPLCFNGRPELQFVGERCAAFYAASNNGTGIDVTATSGITCSADATIENLYNIIVNTASNSILAHVDCCSVVSYAVSRAIATTGTKIIIGCTDQDTTGGVIDYVTAQPTDEQMYHASQFIQLPLQNAIQNYNHQKSNNVLFPALLSLVATDIFSYPV